MTTNPQKIYVAGHPGMVGAAIVNTLQAEGHSNTEWMPVEELQKWIEANRSKIGVI